MYAVDPAAEARREAQQEVKRYALDVCDLTAQAGRHDLMEHLLDREDLPDVAAVADVILTFYGRPAPRCTKTAH